MASKLVCPIEENRSEKSVASAMIMTRLSSKMAALAAMAVKMSENSETCIHACVACSFAMNARIDASRHNTDTDTDNDLVDDKAHEERALAIDT